MTDETSPDYVMVPREPTEEMIEAGIEMLSGIRATSAIITCPDIYKAMLSAAPPSPRSENVKCINCGGVDEDHIANYYCETFTPPPPPPRSDDGSGLTPHSTAVSAIAQERDVGEFAPGTHGCHEALHMASFFAAAVDENLLDHPAIARNPKWAALARLSVAFLADLYQAIGAEHMEAIPTTSPSAISEAVKPTPSVEVGDLVERSRKFLVEYGEHRGFADEASLVGDLASLLIALDAERGRMREHVRRLVLLAEDAGRKNWSIVISARSALPASDEVAT